MRSVSRIADVSINTVTKLLVDAGTACSDYQGQVFRNLLSCDSWDIYQAAGGYSPPLWYKYHQLLSMSIYKVQFHYDAPN